jgi:uncharacterized membrane protein YfcA
MTPLEFTLVVGVVAFFAGFIGALAGVGGGIIIVPALTLFMGVEIRNAIAVSLVCVVATSAGAGAAYVRERITNLRLGMLLEAATVPGAFLGVLLTLALRGRERWLFLLFAAVMLHTVWTMFRLRGVDRGGCRGGFAVASAPPDRVADALGLHGSYHDRSQGCEVAYRVTRTPLGFAVSALAGAVSALLGIGGGIFKVPVMNLAMGIPIKASTATSNFMIGVTAAASAMVYYTRGEILPSIAAPVAIGVLAGARTGARLLGRLSPAVIRWVFIGFAGVSSLQMLWKGIR